MEPSKAQSVIAFYNVFSLELCIEDSTTLRELRQMIPIIVSFIKNGNLQFVDNPKLGFVSAVEFLCRDGLDDGLYAHLDPEAAEAEDDLEMAKILVALMYELRRVQPEGFTAYYGKLKQDDKAEISEIMNNLNGNKELDWSQPLSLPRDGIQNGSLLSEEAAKYKNKATELEAKVKQVELSNHSLNDQLGNTHNELSELQVKHEKLNNSLMNKQNTIEELQKQVKDFRDECEELRYNNSHLQRELKSTKDTLTRTIDKSTADIKIKDNELALIYRRQDDFIKQLAEKEAIESRIKFLDQQVDNAKGILTDLREQLAKALSRANSAETELSSLKKLQKANAALKEEEAANTSTSGESVRSLHDELSSSVLLNGVGLESVSHVNDEEFAQLKTNLEMLENENKLLKKMNEDVRQELDDSRDCDSKTVLEKAMEIDRLKQECESLREDLNKSRQKEMSTADKLKQIEGKSNDMALKIATLEESLGKASLVITTYSTTSDGHESAPDLISLRREVEKLQTENERLVAKMDQFKHEATQEQRLITTHWYQTQIENFQLSHGLGKANSDRNSGISSSQKSPESSSQNHHEQKSLQNSVSAEVPVVSRSFGVCAMFFLLILYLFFGKLADVEDTSDVFRLFELVSKQMFYFFSYNAYNSEPPR